VGRSFACRRVPLRVGAHLRIAENSRLPCNPIHSRSGLHMCPIKLWRRKGKVFADRFHDRILRTPREVRNVLAYVLNNGRRHGSFATKGGPDPLSSGRWFDGWREPLERLHLTWAPIVRARTWLQRVGWQRHGLIPLAVVPGK
jgi:hypothetical protein